ncbi:hypothetical protein ACH4VM_35770 [Streptomyces sp. NPDC020792]|uniref:hypothetical protein n=1 Tax=Streptomyces sp. NPDC020792 TaxID=3365089 RepID=UPI0037AF54CC
MDYYSTLCGPAALPRAGRRALGAYTYLFRHRTYRCRALVLLAMGTVAYVTVYSLAGGLTSLLTILGTPGPKPG